MWGRCPHVHWGCDRHGPQGKSLLCDSELGDLSVSFHTPLSISLPCQSHVTAMETKTSSFSLDLFPSCFLFPVEPPLAGCQLHLAHQSGSRPGFIFYICLICGFHYLNLSCLHLRVDISRVAASTHHLVVHFPPSSPWSLLKNLPFMAVLFLTGIIFFLSFKQRSIFLSVVFGGFCLHSTIYFFSFLSSFPKISFSVIMVTGVLNVFSTP